MYDLFSLGYWPGREKITTHVLVVDDDLTLEPFLRLAILTSKPNAEITWLMDVEHAVSEMENKPFDLVIADQRLLGNQTGLDLWKYIKTSHQDTPFLLISRYKLRLKPPSGNTSEDLPPFMNKPLQPKRLIAIMNKLLL